MNEPPPAQPDRVSSSEPPSQNTAAAPVQSQGADEGGLRAPPHLHGWRKFWWWFDFLILVKLARLRFIGILALIGVAITQWDTLVAYYQKWTRSDDAVVAATDVEYFCPMHPTVVRDNNKEKCPICFMPLSRRMKGETSEEALPAGVVNRVQLSPYRVALAGAETWRVDYVPLAKEIAAVGFVEFNERMQRQVAARIAGRIDRLQASETGQMVEKGDVLAEIYSPELIVTLENVLRTRGSDPMGYKASRRRLELWGIDDEQIDAIEKSGQTPTRLEIRASMGGHVIRKYVREGQYVEVGMPLYDLVDLSTVWISAQVYEDDLAFLPAKLVHPHKAEEVPEVPVSATVRSYPNEVFAGKLAFVYPHVDQQTRTITVRFEVDNPDHKLRPGTTATVRIDVPPSQIALFASPSDAKPGDAATADRTAALAEGRILAVPESAVIDTGEQKIVYRQALPGVYEGVAVTLGPRMSDPHGVAYRPVLAGIDAGELIVTAGSFLIDAETRLNPAAGSIYYGGSGGASGVKSNVTAVRPTTPEDPDAKVRASLAKLTAADRALAVEQELCPVLRNSRLGSMGVPVKLSIDGQTVFVCCAGCEKSARTGGAATLRRVEQLKREHAARGDAGPSVDPQSPLSVKEKPLSTQEQADIAAALAKLNAADRRLALEQRFCVVSHENRLGSMGVPEKIVVGKEPVFICCEGCRDAVNADEAAAIAKAQGFRKKYGVAPAAR